MGTAVAVRAAWLPPGDAGSRMTMESMRSLIQRALSIPSVVEFAHSLAIQCPPRDSYRIALAIQDFLRSRFLFVRDPDGVELIRSPEVQLQQLATRRYISGDCDDRAVLGCALAKAVGIPCKLVGVGETPWRYSHVFGVALPKCYVPVGSGAYPTYMLRVRPVSLDDVRPVGAVIRRRMELRV